MIRAVFTDLDGTLLYEHKTISPASHRAIDQLQAAGIEVGFATGRPFQGIRNALRMVGLDTKEGVSVVNTGSAIRNNRDGSLVDGRMVPHRDVEGLLRFAHAQEVLCAGYTDFEIVLLCQQKPKDEPAAVLEAFKACPPLKREADILQMPVRFVTLEALPEEIGRFTLLGEDAQIDHIQNILADEWRSDLLLVRNEGFSFEILHPEAGKDSCLQLYLQKRGWSMDEVVVIGDGDNDVAMLEAFPRSIAMGNATNKAKKAARWLTKRNEEEGFAYAMEQFVLKG